MKKCRGRRHGAENEVPWRVFHVFTAYTTLWKISKKGGSSNFAVLMNKNDKKYRQPHYSRNE
jgi:hypothetical protein